MATIKVMFILVLLALFTACTTVPGTGRKQLLLVSPSQEMQLGITQFQQVKQTVRISRDPSINAQLQRVARRIVAVAPLPGAQWELIVIDDPKIVNAWCMPGGKIAVYTGILPLTQDDAGLAVVLGHEVAHAVAHHVAERLSEKLLLQFGGQALDAAMKSKPDETHKAVLQAFQLTTELGVALPHSRLQESEADHLGLIFMARAGYDPRVAVQFWSRMAASSAQRGGVPPEYLSDHPADGTRIRQIEAEMPQALAEYKKYLQSHGGVAPK